MASVADLLAQGERTLAVDGRREAEVLLGAALDKPRTYLIAWPEAVVPTDAEQRFAGWMAARSQGTPLAYLLGRREFWSLSLEVSEATLIPRADTELLVERALALLLPDNAAVLDLGTGSGAIALALASERPDWRLSAVDVCADALALATRNAAQLGLHNLTWLCGSWFSSLPRGSRFSLIVSNPPYLASNDPHLEEGDLRFEPQQALVAGRDGLDAIREILADAHHYLTPGGWLLVEHGFEQGAAVRNLFEAAGYKQIDSHCDIQGHERVSAGSWQPPDSVVC